MNEENAAYLIRMPCHAVVEVSEVVVGQAKNHDPPGVCIGLKSANKQLVNTPCSCGVNSLLLLYIYSIVQQLHSFAGCLLLCFLLIDAEFHFVNKICMSDKIWFIWIVSWKHSSDCVSVICLMK